MAELHADPVESASPWQGAEQALPLDALEGDVLDARHPGCLRAVAMHAAQARQPLPQPLAQLAQTAGFRRPQALQQRAGRAEAGDLVHGERAGAQAAFLAAAEAHRLHARRARRCARTARRCPWVHRACAP